MGKNFVDPLETEQAPARELVVFFLIDTSGSMDGDRIGAVNTAIEEALPEMRNIGGNDSNIMFAPLTFGMGVKWVWPDGPKSVETASWSRIRADGMTPMGAAFRELNVKMSKSGFMKRPSLSYSPVVFLLTDGYPNDDWASGLNLLKKNSWFKNALRIGVGIGDDADMDMIGEFVKDSELAIRLRDGKQLKDMIQFILITSSQIGSESIGFDDNPQSDDENAAKTQTMVTKIKDQLDSQDFDQMDGF